MRRSVNLEEEPDSPLSAKKRDGADRASKRLGRGKSSAGEEKGRPAPLKMPPWMKEDDVASPVSPLVPKPTWDAPAEPGARLSFSQLRESAGSPNPMGGGGAGSGGSRRSSKEGVANTDGNDAAKMSLIDFARELQQTAENGSVLLSDRITTVKAKMRAAPGEYLTGTRWELVQRLEELIGAAYYQSAKALSILKPDAHKKPLKPELGDDEESCISAINFKLQKMNTSCGELASLLLQAGQEMDRQQAMKQGVRQANLRRASGIEMDLVEKLSGATAEECLRGSGINPDQITWLPRHFEACLKVVNQLLKASNSVTSMRNAGKIIMMAQRWKKRTGVGGFAEVGGESRAEAEKAMSAMLKEDGGRSTDVVRGVEGLEEDAGASPTA